MMEIGSVFSVAQQLLEIPQAKAAAGAVLAWISEKVFAGKEKTQEKLKRLPEADDAALAELRAKLEFALEDSAELRQELEKKVLELEQLLKQAGVGQPASVSQTHCGAGEIELPDQSGNLKDSFFPLVEFFGILVPGSIFILLIIPSFIVPMQLFLKIVNIFAIQFPYKGFFHTVVIEDFFANSMDSINYFAILKDIVACTTKDLNVFHGVLFFFISYVVGNVFFRQSTDKVDFLSFLKTSRRYKQTGPVKMEREYYFYSDKLCHLFMNRISFGYNKIELYTELYRFFNFRKVNHLLGCMPFDHNKKIESVTVKYFINSIKIRLHFLFPRQYIKIQKKEANIRLMFSIWHVLSSVLNILCIMICLVFLVPSIIFLFAPFFLRMSVDILYQDVLVFFLYLSWPMFILFFCCSFSKRKIETSLHIQRVNEIVCVLELAYFVNVLFPKYKIWHGWSFLHHSDVEDTGKSKSNAVHK